MPRGSKEKYTAKQKRMAHHIEESAKKQGYSPKRAAQIGWATTNKETGGAGRKVRKSAAAKKSSHAARVRAAKKGWATRRQMH